MVDRTSLRTVRRFGGAAHAARAGRPLRLTWIASGEGAVPGDVAADDERLDLRGALVGDERLRVAQVAHHVEIQQDAVTAEDVAGQAAHMTGLDRAEVLGQRG